MKKKIAFIAVVLLTAYIASSAFVLDGMNETQQWSLLFFDLMAFFQICILLWTIKQED